MDTSDFGDANYSQMLQAYHLKPKTKIMSKVYFNHTTRLEIVKLGLVPPATIALKMEGDKFYYGITICSKYDNYSRKYGREIAEQRLNKGFGVMDIPLPLRNLPEKEACLKQLYSLVGSVCLKNKKWKKRITKFNIEQNNGAKVIEIKS